MVDEFGMFFVIPFLESLFVAILETRIPGFYVIHITKPLYALSAYEHTLISNLSREFLPPSTAIFRDLNGFPVGVYVPKCRDKYVIWALVREDVKLLPLSERLAMWPTASMLNKELSDDRRIRDYFGPGINQWYF